jgi:hypothetical protein
MTEMTLKVTKMVPVTEDVTVNLPLTHPETGEALVIDLSRSSDPGNAFAWLGGARNAMVRAHIPQEVQDAFMEEAESGDYAHLLGTCNKWFEVNY